MKKIIISFIVLLSMLVSGRVIAQFTAGVKFGYNASSISTSLDTIKANMSSGFHVGGYARIGKRVQLQPELYYTLSGSTFETGSNPLTDWKQKVTVGSLDIPVLLSFTLLKTNSLKWRLMVGPELTFVVNSKVENVNLTGPIGKSDLRTTNWFIQAGTGIDIWLLTLDVRYQAGLNSLISDITAPANGYPDPYPVNSKSNLFVVSLGVKIL